MGVALVTMSLVTVPYFSQAPGSATPLEALIEVEGTEEFPSDGEIFFTTVRLTGELSVLEYIGAWFDSSVELIDEDLVLQGQSRDQQRERNLAMMTASQEVAKRVALDHLGYDVIDPNGALIVGVEPDSGANGVLERGDVVVEAGGLQIIAQQDLVDQIRAREPGAELDLIVMRPIDDVTQDDELESERLELVVVLGESDVPGRALMGVNIQQSIDLVDLPFEIEVNTSSVGGPSAGLALTLSMFDLLTEGELTGGIEVATTGEINLAGAVLAIGGVEQKAHAVRRAGIDLFLVPAANYEAAAEAAGDELEVVAVDTFADAVRELAVRGGNGLEFLQDASLAPAA
ncbi:MAG: hypothetical protein GY708_12820 [Actinomycetia bacterium]|nr:hypothetical protein [Actinomycetes bacterium]MCP4961546.1 hypothetical protein [Actinomycetes bacterium]